VKYTVESFKPQLDQFLEPLLRHAGFNLTYTLHSAENPHPEVENPEVTVRFTGEDIDLLLSNRAELLLALEHLSMEALRFPPEDHSLISFDANDYRLLRIEELRMSALAAADKVKRTHVPFHFNPMTSRERRIIHLALRDQTELRSESVGVGPGRSVVVVPADMPTPPAPPAPAFRGGARGGFGDRSGGFGRSDRRDGPDGPPRRGRDGGRPPRGRDRQPR
jgi:spoIIIJ-associated protein